LDGTFDRTRLEPALREAIVNLQSCLTQAMIQPKGIPASVRDSERPPAILVSPMRPMYHCDLLTTTAPLLEAMPCNEFTFVINEATFQISVVDAAMFSPAVGEQFQVDACA
jgi:hypothetical protein